MAHILVDRVKETTTTTGTGTLALLGAVAQFRAFSAVMANNDTTLYVIAGQTGTEWEVGVGTWTTGNNLARTTILASSNAGSVVTLSAGTKNVFITLTPVGQWPQLLISSGGVINFNAGDVTLTHSSNKLALAGGTLEIAQSIVGAGGAAVQITTGLDMQSTNIGGIQGSASVGALMFNVGTLQTTPSDGSIEHDATNFYGTTDVGNRGYIPIRHLIRANAARTYTSNTSAQTVFNAPANGRLTLEAGTYRFGGVFSWGTMSATSGNRNLNILGAGTAVVSNWMWHAWGFDGATATAGAAGSTHMITSTSPASIVTATIGTSLIVSIEGTVEINTAGTVIPTTTMVTASASVLTIGSYMWFERLGTDALVSIGQWD